MNKNNFYLVGISILVIFSSISQLNAAKIVVSPGFYEYKKGGMDNCERIVKEEQSTIKKANTNTDFSKFDIIVWETCNSDDNKLLFPHINSLIKNGKYIILIGGNSCMSYNITAREHANNILRDYGMYLTSDDDFMSYTVNPNKEHELTKNLDNFIGFRNAFVRIQDRVNVKSLAKYRNKNILAIYENHKTNGILIAGGYGEGFLVGVYDKRTGEDDYRVLELFRNIIKKKNNTLNTKKQNTKQTYYRTGELLSNIDLDNQITYFYKSGQILPVNIYKEYKIMNKNTNVREKYFKFSKPKKDLEGSDKMDNIYLGNALLYDFIEAGQGKPVGQFGENIMKALFPTSSSYTNVKFKTTLSSKARYGKYRVIVKFTLKYKTKTQVQVLGIHKNSVSYKEYSEVAEYILQPKGHDTEELDFGKIKVSDAASSIGAFASGDSVSKLEDFKYEIVDIQPIY